ncbi:BgTH12-04770 [Blumeria graminis f. sp. triticale]|uniref:non-specific serine/threonine protein kinase n=1 Tax=Blumeria graminis f. sp. triticale TaxID=1689686 RepID=A0A9W4GC98_BLUGR|nr:BgTH12-04770 [Blumeria graminis f. sp. triticale]
MGQGFSLTTISPGTAGIDVPELRDLVYEKSMGTAQFMKSIRARHRDGVVLVKVIVKPWIMTLEPYKRKIIEERKLLADVPNALAYQRIVETDTNGFLVRQYLYSSLYDRLSTRPFLEDIEKKWLAFQLLCGVRDCHARNVFHGDIKTENVLVTSWNWLFLSDFSSSFKPSALPEDNPADFSYFFDTAGRRTCYLAPERFRAAGDPLDRESPITWAMDIFSAGCVIAELFLEAPIFNLSQLYKYKRGDYEPITSHLNRISDTNVRQMIASMIHLDPSSRHTAEKHLQLWKNKVFPEYFYSFLQQYMSLITDPSPGRRSTFGPSANLGECDERIERIFYDFDKISFFLGYEKQKQKINIVSQTTSGLELFPVHLNIPNNEHPVSTIQKQMTEDGTLIFLSLVVSSIRNTARATAKTKACDLLLAFSERLTDEAKLDRVLPYLVALLNDKAAVVRAAAIRSLTQLMALVKVISPVNAHVFPEYILPRMQVFLPGTTSEPTSFVRATYAACLGSLSHSASRFLDMVAALRADGSLPTVDLEVDDDNNNASEFQGIFDNAKVELIEIFAYHTKTLMTDNDSSVKRAFLKSVPELCLFFGAADSNDIILSHLNTYLNDRDWMLKCAFFETIVGVAIFLGGSSLEEFILPLVTQALTDPEEFVVKSALHSLANMAELGLFQRSKLWKLVNMITRFSMHPNIWIREAAAMFLSSSAQHLSIADKQCIFLPLIRPYLKTWTRDFTELGLLDNLKRPLSRSLLDLSIVWATKSEKGKFWSQMHQMRTFYFDPNLFFIPALSEKDSTDHALQKEPKNKEDELWISKLRNMGLLAEDEFKLLCLREYIWRCALAKPIGESNKPLDFNNIFKLHTINVTPHTVMFDDEHHKNVERQTQITDSIQENDVVLNKIVDTLQDISAPTNEVVSNQTSDLNGKKYRCTEQIERTSRNSSPIIREPTSSPAILLPSTNENMDSQRTSDLNESPSDNETGMLGGTKSKDKLTNTINRVKRQPSAINLMRSKDPAKTLAETCTTSTNVFGKTDSSFYPSNLESSMLVPTKENDRKLQYQARFRGAYNYTGNDPNILKMLDSMYVENYRNNAAEFGPTIAPSSRRRTLNKISTLDAKKPWKPQGMMVTTFSEHSGAVNHISVASDHVFFLTGGDDGCVKVWDTGRLERNITHRSRQTHTQGIGAKITALCFIENTHSFASCASDGSINITRVDCANINGTMKYSKLKLLREYQLPKGEMGVWSFHFMLETSSVLMIATNKSRILAIDPHRMNVKYVLENPVHHGTPMCFVVDKKRQWLLLGTSHGILDLWDLRFRVRLKAWGIPGATAIFRMTLHPTRGRGRWVCVAGGSSQGEVTVWDVEKTQCREVYRAGGSREGLRGYHPWPVDEDQPESMLSRFATAIEPNSSSTPDRGMRAMIAGPDSHDDNGEAKVGFLITGGADRKIRFWDVQRIDQSSVVSGLSVDEAKPSFTAAHPTASLILNTERIPHPMAPSAPNASPRAPSSTRSPVIGRPSRSTVISLQQQQLLRSHLDSILDIALLESPYSMIVSVDRSGVCFVFH